MVTTMMRRALSVAGEALALTVFLAGWVGVWVALP